MNIMSKKKSNPLVFDNEVKAATGAHCVIHLK